VARCKPNAGHYALAAAEQQARERGVEFTVVTQNIDRLHQAAGSSNVVEMHGSLW
jgi:NAD-dependent SIR2 family protein deacetylase